MEHDETGCQSPLEGPVLCVNNCGFFGSAANMNMCSKCYKDMTSKQEQAQLAASSIENFVNRSLSADSKEESASADSTILQTDMVEVKAAPIPAPSLNASSSGVGNEPKPQGRNRCSACKKRVGLMGFTCRCGDLFCGSHRYSDKHDCQYDYRSAGRDAIAKANPIVKAEKLDKI